LLNKSIRTLDAALKKVKVMQNYFDTVFFYFYLSLCSGPFKEAPIEVQLHDSLVFKTLVH